MKTVKVLTWCLGVLVLAIVPFVALKLSDPAKPGMMKRDDFWKATKGKTPQEVLDAVGEPDIKTPNDEWIYKNKTFDRRNIDKATSLIFRPTADGFRVAFINYWSDNE